MNSNGRSLSLRKFLDKRGMFRRIKACSKDLQHTKQSAPQEGRRVQPKAGEFLAAQHSLCVWRHPLEMAVFKHKPANVGLIGEADDVLAYAVPPVGLELAMQIDGDAARSHFADEFRATLHVIV